MAPEIVIDDFSSRRAFTGSYAVWHIHWPERMATKTPLARAFMEVVVMLFLLVLAKLRRTRIVWTVHNLESHERSNPRLERILMLLFVTMVDGIVSLSEYGQTIALAEFPRLAKTPRVVVPHGHYIDALQTSIDKADARQTLGISPGEVVIAYAGRIAPYKNVAQLIHVFRALDRTNLRLLVAGEPTSSELGDSLEQAASGDPRIDLSLMHVPDEELERLIRAADLVVLPYREILNSGSVLFALSMSRPVLVPAKGAIPELASIVGSEWIRTYAGELGPSVLAEALDCQATEAASSLAARLDQHFGWHAVGVQTARFLQSLEKAS